VDNWGSMDSALEEKNSKLENGAKSHMPKRSENVQTLLSAI